MEKMSHKSNFFYARLAATNLRKNYTIYFPYILACIGTVFSYFLLMALANNEGMKNIPVSESLQILFRLGTYVAGVFSVIFLLYANSFLMKQRKKEIGLYSILGLEKRHIACLMTYETVFMAVLGIGIGILAGIVFGKLCFLLLLFLIHVSPDSEFLVSPVIAGKSALFFAAIFAITLVINYIQIKGANPIELLRDEKAGEREPRASVFLTLVGALGILYGYYHAVTVKSAFQSIPVFFTSVICVIFGTYAAFTSGSIAFLKYLKRKKKIYYTPNHFIAISNMLYRMKKNAAGLASICIISTMVLVVISTTLALFQGKEQMLHNRYPYDLTIVTNEAYREKKEIAKQLDKQADKLQIRLKNTIAYENTELKLRKGKGGFLALTQEDSQQQMLEELYEMNFLTLSDYNRLTGEKETLSKNQLLLYCHNGKYKEETISILKETYEIKQILSQMDFLRHKQQDGAANEFYLVLADDEVQKGLYARYQQQRGEEGFYGDGANFYIRADLEGLSENKLLLEEKIKEKIKSGFISDRDFVRVYGAESHAQQWDTLYGGLLFLGIILGILFIIALVLIIYFKQVSEGYEDRSRFEMMQKVGMGAEETRQAINKQIRMVFLIPAVGALVHILFAFRILEFLLGSLGFYDRRLLAYSILIVVLFYSILYSFVYSRTSRVYQKMIGKNK